MKALLATMGLLPLALFAALSAGCTPELDPGGDGETTVPDDDPLAVPEELDPASLDALHRDIIVRSCAATPGLCHHGQFEPNLSTPALTYENMVYKPGIERVKQYRVKPGDPSNSLLVDKLRNKEVISQMPLGAAALPEAEIAALEKWIQDGALRRPGAEPPPQLNNPPAEPEIAVFDQQGNRLDAAGPFSVAVGTTLTIRHSVQDFETDDAAIPFAGIILQLADGRKVNLTGAPDGDGLGPTAFDASGAPEGKGDLLNFQFDWTVPATVDLVADGGATSQAAAAGLSFSLIAAYLDSLEPNAAMLTFAIEPDLVKVTP
jgi:hypothetical protein